MTVNINIKIKINNNINPTNLNVIGGCVLINLSDPIHPRKVSAAMAFNLWREDNEDTDDYPLAFDYMR